MPFTPHHFGPGFLIPPVGLIPRGFLRLLNENPSRSPRLLAAGSFIQVDFTQAF